MSVINNQDWPALKEKFLQATPFPSICIDNFLSPEFALELSRSYPNFSNAQNQGLEFSTVNEKGKIQITDPEKFPDPVKKLHEALASEEFITSMQTLSGIDKLSFDDQFAGGGMHITKSSGILDVHVDFNFSEKLQLYRRLNILIYLNEEWQEDWGGNIELWDKEVKNCVHSFSPILNRCLIFSTSDYSFHGVTAVTTPPGFVRKSFAIYLYNKRPSASVYGEFHSTVFKARPDESFKKYWQMPAETGIKILANTFHSGKQLVKKFIGK